MSEPGPTPSTTHLAMESRMISWITHLSPTRTSTPNASSAASSVACVVSVPVWSLDRMYRARVGMAYQSSGSASAKPIRG